MGLGGNGGASSIASSADVVLNTPVASQTLTFDASVSKWRNTSVPVTPVTTSVKTAAYTLALADAGTIIEITSASSVLVTIPTQASVAFPIGTVIELCQSGSAQFTITPASGVTLRSPATLSSRTQWSSVGLRKRATNEWVISGDLG